MESQDLKSYYGAALVGLLALEARKPTGRRVGSEADARWMAFRGDLAAADRLDLLIRDADAQWPGAFGARTVFSPRGVFDDDAFGPAWQGLDPVVAEELWREITTIPVSADVGTALAAVASRWQHSLLPCDIDTLTATTRLVLAGPSAIAAAITAFAAGTDLDWSDQVVVVASTPAARQLAAMAPAFLNTARSTAFATEAQYTGWCLVVSADASNEDAVRAQKLVGAAT